MSETRAYYETYWNKPDLAPPSQDPTTAARKKMLAAALEGLQGQRVLDVGCGMGVFTGYLAELGMKPVGMDLSENAIRYAQKAVANAVFRVGTPDMYTKEYQGQFKAVWCTEVLEHVFDVYGFLTALHQFLAPQGRLVLTTPYHGLIKDILIDLMGYATHYNPFGGHIRFFNRQSLNRCLTHCGFTAVRWSAIGRMPPLYRSFFVIAEKSHEPLPPPPADA